MLNVFKLKVGFISEHIFSIIIYTQWYTYKQSMYWLLVFVWLTFLQLQMDKLPSRHAITEVMSWITLMENAISKDEENIKNIVGHKAVQEYLQKYKVFKEGIVGKSLYIDICYVIALDLVLDLTCGVAFEGCNTPLI